MAISVDKSNEETVYRYRTLENQNKEEKQEVLTSLTVNAERRAAPRPEAGYMTIQRCRLASASVIPPVKPRREREDLLSRISLKRIQKTSIYYAVSPT